MQSFSVIFDSMILQMFEKGVLLQRRYKMSRTDSFIFRNKSKSRMVSYPASKIERGSSISRTNLFSSDCHCEWLIQKLSPSSVNLRSLPRALSVLSHVEMAFFPSPNSSIWERRVTTSLRQFFVTSTYISFKGNLKLKECTQLLPHKRKHRFNFFYSTTSKSYYNISMLPYCGA